MPSTSRVGVRPQVEVVIEVRRPVILRQPDGVLRQRPEVVVQVPQVLVEVDCGLIARLPDPVAEGQRALGNRLAPHAAGPGVLAGDRLPVEGHRVGEVVPLQGGQHELRLLPGLLRAGGLGEEVDPHLQPRVQGPPDVPLKLAVQEQPALGIAPVAQAEHGKFHPVLRHRRPVDLPLVDRHVDPGPGPPAVLLIGHPAPAVHGEACLVIGGGRHPVHNVQALSPELDGGLRVRLLRPVPPQRQVQGRGGQSHRHQGEGQGQLARPAAPLFLQALPAVLLVIHDRTSSTPFDRFSPIITGLAAMRNENPAPVSDRRGVLIKRYDLQQHHARRLAGFDVRLVPQGGLHLADVGLAPIRPCSDGARSTSDQGRMGSL